MISKHITLGLLFLVAFAFIQGVPEPRNPDLGRTGAPGETTCESAGCHSGGAFVGTVSISGVPDTALPSTSYAITLTQKSNAVTSGFELTVLDGAIKKAGNLTAGSGSNIGNLLGKQYIRQSNAVRLSSGSSSWTFNWTSPATVTQADSIVFYFVSLAANGVNGERGDNALVGKKKVVLKTTTASNDLSNSKKAAVCSLGQGAYKITDAEGIDEIRALDLNGKLLKYEKADHQIDFVFKLEVIPSGVVLFEVKNKLGKSTLLRSIL